MDGISKCSVTFDAVNHVYKNAKGKELISVTQLLRKHGLAPDYSRVSTVVLTAAADKGTLIHEDIHDYITKGELGFTTECDAFAEWFAAKKAVNIVSEGIVSDGELIAGTIDLAFTDCDGKLYLCDYKTSSEVNRKAYSWQLALYEYLFGVKFDKKIILHLRDFKLKEIEAIDVSREKVLALIDAEKNGVIYTEERELIDTDLLREVADAEAEIARITEEKKAIDEKISTLKQALYDKMTKLGIDKYEGEGVKLTKVYPYTRDSIDSKRLKSEHPDIYVSYLKTSEIAGTVKITV